MLAKIASAPIGIRSAMDGATVLSWIGRGMGDAVTCNKPPLQRQSGSAA